MGCLRGELGELARIGCRRSMEGCDDHLTVCYWTWPFSSLIYPLKMVISIVIVDISNLVGGLEPWNFAWLSIQLGIIIRIPTDFHILRRGGSTTNQYWTWPFSSLIYPLKGMIFHSKLLVDQRVISKSWMMVSIFFHPFPYLGWNKARRVFGAQAVKKTLTFSF